MSIILSALSGIDPVYCVAAILAVTGLLFVFFLFTIITRLKRCPANRVLVIYGKASRRGGFRCFHGGAAFVWPLIQDFAWLSLEPSRITVSARPLLKCDSTEYRAPQIFSVAIGISEELIDTAAVRLLGLSKRDIDRHAEDIITAQLDRLVDQAQSENVQMDPEQFHHELETTLEAKLNELGLTLINFRRE
jgi:flotillin